MATLKMFIEVSQRPLQLQGLELSEGFQGVGLGFRCQGAGASLQHNFRKLLGLVVCQEGWGLYFDKQPNTNIPSMQYLSVPGLYWYS